MKLKLMNKQCLKHPREVVEGVFFIRTKKCGNLTYSCRYVRIYLYYGPACNLQNKNSPRDFQG